MRIFTQNFQLWVQCAKCSRYPRALKFFPKCFYTNSHNFQGTAKIFEEKTFFRYTLVDSKQIISGTNTIKKKLILIAFCSA